MVGSRCFCIFLLINELSISEFLVKCKLKFTNIFINARTWCLSQPGNQYKSITKTNKNESSQTALSPARKLIDNKI